MVSLSVVIPVYRNAATLSELHRRLTRTLDAAVDDFEVLFVDDASPDGSLDVLQELAWADRRVGVLSLASNVGQNRAVLVGLKEARGHAVAVMDADLQDRPEEIPRLLAAMDGSVAAIFAGRRGAYESASRLLTSRLFKRALAVLSGGRLPADAGLFVLLRRDLVDWLAGSDRGNPYVLGLIARSGLPLRSIPVERVPRPSGRSSYGLGARLRVAFRAAATTLGGAGMTVGQPTVARIRLRVGAPFEAIDA